MLSIFKHISFINVSPNPCGVGQEVTVDFWTAVPMQTSQVDTNLTVQITNPLGVVTIQGPYVSDITGGTTIEYAPTMLGNYTFECVFLGMRLSGTSGIGYEIGMNPATVHRPRSW